MEVSLDADEEENRMGRSKKANTEAPDEDRTHDLSLTKGTHYHYATEALAVHGNHVTLLIL